MKRKILLLLGLGVLTSLSWVGVTHAANVRASDTPTVSQQETVDGALYTVGKKIVIAGTVKGDVYCAGMEVEITGVVEGDVMCAGQTVTIGGKVLGDVRVAGGDITISANIEGSVTLAADTTKFTVESQVGRDVVLGGQQVTFSGAIGRDVLGAAGAVTIKGAIGRNFEADATQLLIDGSAHIAGDLTYQSPEQATLVTGAVVGGKTNYTQLQGDTQVDINVARLWTAGFWFAAVILMGVLAIAIAPRWFDSVGATIRTNIFGTFVTGSAALLLTPVACILLFITLLGLPLAVVLMGLWFAATFSALTFASYALGWFAVEKLAWPSRGQRIASLFIGALILTLLGLVPWVGPVFIFAAIVFGLGGVVKTVGAYVRPKAASKA